MPERDSDFLEVLVGQIAENARINVVVGKTLRVLPEAKSAEPIRNLLHCGHRLLRVWPKRTLEKTDTISRPFLDGTSCACRRARYRRANSTQPADTARLRPAT